MQRLTWYVFKAIHHGRYLAFIVGICCISCETKYEISEIRIDRSNWETLSIRENYELASINPFADKKPKPSSVSITVTDAVGNTLTESTSRSLSIPDTEVGDEEKLSIRVSSRINGKWVVADTFIYASPKKILFEPSFKTDNDLTFIYHNLNVAEYRTNYDTKEYELISYLDNTPKLTTWLEHDDSQFVTAMATDGSTYIPDQFRYALRDELYENLAVTIRYSYRVEHRNRTAYSKTYSHPLTITPYVNDCKDDHAWTFQLKPYESQYFKYYVSADEWGVFTLENLWNSSDLDLFVYSDSDYSDLVLSSIKVGSQNDLGFTEDGGRYYYVRVSNQDSHHTKGKLYTHDVDPLEVVKETLVDYAAQRLLTEFLAWIFDVPTENEVGRHLTDLAANISLSALKGDDGNSLTQSALANELCAALKAGTNGGEEATIACNMGINLAKEVYKYDM